MIQLRFVARALLVFLVLFCQSTHSALGQCEPREIQKILGSDVGVGDKFGFATDYEGRWAVMGAFQHGGAAPDAGAAYVFNRLGGLWVQQDKLIGHDTDLGDWFGYAVTVERDTILVGARADDDQGGNSGSVYAFEFDGSSWAETQKIVPADGADADLFGFALDLDGNTAAIAAVNVQSERGAVYVYRRESGAWTLEQKLMASDAAPLDGFGYGVALDGDTLAIGAIGDDDAGDRSGSVYVFTRAGSVWSERAKFQSADGAASDNFGRALALEGTTLVVGAPGDDDRFSTSGSAYVFEGEGSTWTQTQKLTASDAAANAQLGTSVALKEPVVIVGAWNDVTSDTGTGSAYVYARNGATWLEKAKLVASDAAQSDNMGSAIGFDGRTAIVGASNTDDLGNNSGSAYVFDMEISSWSLYGSGWAGTLGIPSMHLDGSPDLGETRTLSADNSSGQTSLGVVLLGFDEASSGTALDGEILVLPTTVIPVQVPSSGLTVSAFLPQIPGICGVSLFTQLLQLDSGASQGVSFTRGLRLDLGS